MRSAVIPPPHLEADVEGWRRMLTDLERILRMNILQHGTQNRSSGESLPSGDLAALYRQVLVLLFKLFIPFR
jgi:hypothetical protein